MQNPLQAEMMLVFPPLRIKGLEKKGCGFHFLYDKVALPSLR